MIFYISGEKAFTKRNFAIRAEPTPETNSTLKSKSFTLDSGKSHEFCKNKNKTENTSQI